MSSYAPAASHRATVYLLWAMLAAVLGILWWATLVSAPSLMALLSAQLSGAAPMDRVTFVALSGLMMMAMMLPSAVPMFATFRGLTAKTDTTTGEGFLRTGLFVGAYGVVWTVFTAASLVALMGFGVMSAVGSVATLAGGAVLVAAGVYQFSSAKEFCLSSCRSPFEFLVTHWRSSRKGAWRMGLAHASYCLGCCWLLMIVLFVAGAMSALWMGIFAGLIVAEKASPRGEQLARAIGIVAVGVGVFLLGVGLGLPVRLPLGAFAPAGF